MGLKLCMIAIAAVIICAIPPLTFFEPFVAPVAGVVAVIGIILNWMGF